VQSESDRSFILTVTTATPKPLIRDTNHKDLR
jgi:hypothetical protein